MKINLLLHQTESERGFCALLLLATPNLSRRRSIIFLLIISELELWDLETKGRVLVSFYIGLEHYYSLLTVATDDDNGELDYMDVGTVELLDEDFKDMISLHQLSNRTEDKLVFTVR